MKMFFGVILIGLIVGVCLFSFRVYLIDFYYSMRYSEEITVAKKLLLVTANGSVNDAKNVWVANAIFFRGDNLSKLKKILSSTDINAMHAIAITKSVEGGETEVNIILCINNDSQKYIDVTLKHTSNRWLLVSLQFSLKVRKAFPDIFLEPSL